jgi:hypothetical protein
MPPFLRAVLLAALSMSAGAQVIPVEQIEKSLLVRSEPTLTLLRQSPAARAVLVSIPGGEGRIGLKANMPFDPAAEARTSFGKMLKRLAEPSVTSGSFHVVAFDSPYILPAVAYLTSRSTKDHMVRMESVVQHYRDRFKLPVWIMGHSNGGYSIAEFLKYLQDRKKEDLLSGMVFSAGRNISSFGSTASLPALFMIAERDGCHSTTPVENQRIFEKFKAGNKAVTEFVLIRGGEPEGDPCSSGIHMYHNAHEEVAKVVDEFVVRQLGPR